jgi:hypothetical protein|tara:strand:- start:52 stop:312 length:261 start_codon:yes stop_codon:yes gene_type:complete
MAKKENKKENAPMLNLDGKEYDINSMNDDQKTMVNHIADLNRKIDTTTFNLQQLQFGRQAFVDGLKAALSEENKYPYNKEQESDKG